MSEHNKLIMGDKDLLSCATGPILDRLSEKEKRHVSQMSVDQGASSVSWKIYA